MKILAIETCFSSSSLCLFCDGNFFEKIDHHKNNQATSLPIFTQDLIIKNNIKIKELDAVIVNHGPGSFTGIRIGIAFALGLVTPFKIPLYGVSSLENFVLDDFKTTIAIKAIGENYYVQQFEGGYEVDDVQYLSFENLPQGTLTIGNPGDLVTAQRLIRRFFFKKPQEYKEPLYVRSVNAVIGKTKIIKN